MLYAIKSDQMAVFGQDRLQKAEVKVDASPCLGEHERVVGRIPQFVGCWIQDDVGYQVGAAGKLVLVIGYLSNKLDGICNSHLR
jgi:hypothetical protein